MSLTLLSSFLFHPLQLILHIHDTALRLLATLCMCSSIFFRRPQFVIEIILFEFQEGNMPLSIFGSQGSRLESSDGLLRRQQTCFECFDLCIGFRDGAVEQFKLVEEITILLNFQGILSL